MVEKGWKVVASDGSEVGTVAEALGDSSHDIFDGLAVSTGLFSKAVYVPSERVGEIVEGTVSLTLGADEFAELGPYERRTPDPAGQLEAGGTARRRVSPARCG